MANRTTYGISEIVSAVMRALNASTDGIMLTDARLDEPGPQMLWVNSALLAITGYSEQDLVGKTPRIFQGQQTDRALLSSLKRSLKGGQTFHGETINYRKDGRPYWVEWDIAPVRDDDGGVEYFISIQRDVSERKSREFKLQQITDALERSNEALERYARTTAHDLRSPMQAMRFYAALLLRSASERLEERERDYVASLQEIVSRMADTLDSLFELAKLREGSPAFEEIDLNKVLTEARADLSAEIARTDAIIEASPLGTVWGDATLLRLVFQNLLSNAIKFGHPQRCPIIRVRQGEGAAKGIHVITFDDNGIGIPDHEAEAVFADGYRIESLTSADGSGIGLASVRRILEQCGGSIRLTPKSSVGSCFELSLPATDSGSIPKTVTLYC